MQRLVLSSSCSFHSLVCLTISFNCERKEFFYFQFFFHSRLLNFNVNKVFIIRFLNPSKFNWIIVSSVMMRMKWDKWIEIVHQIVAWSKLIMIVEASTTDCSDLMHLTWRRTQKIIVIIAWAAQCATNLMHRRNCLHRLKESRILIKTERIKCAAKKLDKKKFKVYTERCFSREVTGFSSWSDFNYFQSIFTWKNSLNF